MASIAQEAERLGKLMHESVSPMHVALKQGEWELAMQMLDENPMLAEEADNRQRLPLHISSEKGQIEMVKKLLQLKNLNMCFARDFRGMNPVHYAATKGDSRILEQFLSNTPQAVFERTAYGGETVLHLCVKHGQLDTLKYLLNSHCYHMRNLKDKDGNTVLHLAVAYKSLETVEYLAKDLKRMNLNVINSCGMTAMDIIDDQYTQDTCDNIKLECINTTVPCGKIAITKNYEDDNNKKIWHTLRTAKAISAEIASEDEKHKDWITRQRDALMIVASMIATMGFQAGVNPPGGVWQDNNPSKNQTAGQSVWATGGNNDEDDGLQYYSVFMTFNTVGIIASLTVVLLLISGLHCRRESMAILTLIMWISVSSTSFSYLFSVFALSNKKFSSLPFKALVISLGIWLVLWVVLPVTHMVRFVSKFIRDSGYSILRCLKSIKD